MAVVLVMFTQKGERRDFKVRGEKAVLGRNGDCDIQISLGVVSRRHCEIRVREGKVTARDLGSSNGTYVNDRRIQEIELHPGDTLMVGPVIFTVVIDGSPTEIKAVKTIVEGKRKPDKGETHAKQTDETGSLDLDDSAALGLMDEDQADGSQNPLAELEELSRQKRTQS